MVEFLNKEALSMGSHSLMVKKSVTTSPYTEGREFDSRLGWM